MITKSQALVKFVKDAELPDDIWYIVSKNSIIVSRRTAPQELAQFILRKARAVLKDEQVHVPREVFDAKVNELNTRINSLSDIKEAYDRVLIQQAEVMKQQSSFIAWIKYATILVPIAVVVAPIIEVLIRHFLNIP